jgi:hypothetical protein
MTPAPLPDDWTDDAAWLVQAVDPYARLARLVRMDQAGYRAAAFLDDRILGDRVDARLCPLDPVIAAAGAIDAPPAGWIFHIGHVGSTLVSRLLGEVDGVLAIREPRSLRDLAVCGDERETLARSLSRVLARPLEDRRHVVVKATSFVSDWAHLLVEPDAPALFLYAPPERYIAGILAGPNSRLELAALADVRGERLAAHGIRLAEFEASDAHRAAAAWVCEMVALEVAAEGLGDRVMWREFDPMLAEMAAALAEVAGHFGIAVGEGSLEAIAAGPMMHSYSKATQFDYSPALRDQLLADAARDHRADMAEAMAAIDKVGGREPIVAKALGRRG